MEEAPATYEEAKVVRYSSYKEGGADAEDISGAVRRKSDGAYVIEDDIIIDEIKITPDNYMNGFDLLAWQGSNDERFVFEIKERPILNYTTGKYIDNLVKPEVMEGISLKVEDAIAKAKPFVDAINPNLVLSDTCAAIDIKYGDDDNDTYIPLGYTLYYTRQYNGIDCKRVRFHKGECLAITVGVEGVLELLYNDPIEVIETLENQVNLLPFNNIKEIFDKEVFNANYSKTSKGLYLKVNKVELGMIKTSKLDNGEYKVVPAWKFYGGEKNNRKAKVTNKQKSDLVYTYGDSLLTINAIDGSIIENDLQCDIG
jgi:hypothetical protein